MTNEPMLDVKGLAAALACSPEHVYELTRDGRIPHYRLGKTYRFRLSEVLDALAQPVAGPAA